MTKKSEKRIIRHVVDCRFDDRIEGVDVLKVAEMLQPKNIKKYYTNSDLCMKAVDQKDIDKINDCEWFILDVDQEFGYYDDISYHVVLIGQRYETEEEFKERKKKQKNAARKEKEKQRQREFALYEKLKRKFEE